VLRNLQTMFDHGRLGGTGYLSILPVDQGIEHSAARRSRRPAYFDPENIVKLAIEGGCNAVASTLGVLGSVSRKYAHKIPFMVKFNHNEFLTYPNKPTTRSCSPDVEQAFDMGAVRSARRSTSARPNRARARSSRSAGLPDAHELGLATVLWCYLRNRSSRRTASTTTRPPT
jgi:class I fructose-bisphosphate aldolase